MDTPQSITITSEDEAIDLLRKLVEGYTIPEGCKITFESWPRFVIRIEGVDFDGTIPTRIMPTMLELQREIYRVYCLAVNGDENTKKLTKKDREQLELLVRVDKGSSVYDAILDTPIMKILQDALARMSPNQLTAVIIVASLSVTSLFFWKYWLNNRIKEKELDHKVQLSELEIEKMEVVRKAAQKFPLAQEASEGMEQVRNDLLTKLKPEDRLEVSAWEGEQAERMPVLVNGHLADQVTKKERETATEKIIEGEFIIQSAIFSHANEFRVNIQRKSDGYSFSADIPHGVLDETQQEALKNNSWDRKYLNMRILTKELHERLTSAKIVQIFI